MVKKTQNEQSPLNDTSNVNLNNTAVKFLLQLGKAKKKKNHTSYSDLAMLPQLWERAKQRARHKVLRLHRRKTETFLYNINNVNHYIFLALT